MAEAGVESCDGHAVKAVRPQGSNLGALTLPEWRVLVLGAVSGSISRIVTYPADTIKARIQVQGAGEASATYRSAHHALRCVLRVEGPAGLYRGIVPVLAGALPGTMAYYWGYEVGKRASPLLLWDGASDAAADLTTGAVAQMTAGLLYTPMDVVKERMQMHGFLRGASFGSAGVVVRSLVAQHGPLGLFRGYWLTNSVWIPWNALYVTGYEASKRALAALLGSHGGASGTAVDPLPAWAVAASAAAAGGVAAALTNPIDIVKTRYQVLTALPSTGPVTVASIVGDLRRSDGARWVWRGVGARVASLAPGTAVSWLCYEVLKGTLGVR